MAQKKFISDYENDEAFNIKKYENYAVVLENPDLQSIVIRRFRNTLIRRGNKIRAFKLFSLLISALRSRYPDERPFVVLFLALEAVRPTVIIFNKKVGGTTYKLPLLLSFDQSYGKAAHWIIGNASVRKKESAPFLKRLIKEVSMSYEGRNYNLVKRRDDLHFLALDNRPFLKRLHRYRRY